MTKELQFLIYNTPQEDIKVNVVMRDETIWLTQKAMAEFSESIDAFLTFREYKILDGKGRISKTQADKKAGDEYDVFNQTQKIESDFDKAIKSLENKGDK